MITTRYFKTQLDFDSSAFKIRDYFADKIINPFVSFYRNKKKIYLFNMFLLDKYFVY